MSRQPHWEQAWYPEIAFGGFSRVDGTVAFYTRVRALLKPAFIVLNVGCGRGSHSEDSVAFRREMQDLRGECGRVIGIDVDPAAESNSSLDEFRLIQGDSWPVEDNSVDLCLCDYVLEHIETPDCFFAECARTIKAGGLLCMRTPNAWSYPILASWLIPNRLHAWLINKVQFRRKAQDVFPTVYRCNTARRLRSLMTRHGFDACVYGHEAEPAYLAFSRIAYSFAVVYHRLTPSILKTTLLAFGRKRKSA